MKRTAKQFSQTKYFRDLCRKHGVEPTKRAAAKYMRGEGVLMERIFEAHAANESNAFGEVYNANKFGVNHV